MIQAFTGKTGSGKTFLMVNEAFSYWLQGRNIYSNTVLDFSGQLSGKFKTSFWEKVKFWNKKYKRGKIVYFENINDIIDIRDGVILFDEAQVLFNARQWENLPEEFQYKLQQHRKHQIDLLCTTQNMGTIDITYRRLVHSWIHCKNLFQLGGSPRIWFGVFMKQIKDVDMLYNSVDDLVVPTLKTRIFFIHRFSKTLYDTMYDIGFKKFKLLWLSNGIKKLILVIPKKMTTTKAIREIKQLQELGRLSKRSSKFMS
jgi:hypothetical protein